MSPAAAVGRVSLQPDATSRHRRSSMLALLALLALREESRRGGKSLPADRCWALLRPIRRPSAGSSSAANTGNANTGRGGDWGRGLSGACCGQKFVAGMQMGSMCFSSAASRDSVCLRGRRTSKRLRDKFGGGGGRILSSEISCLSTTNNQNRPVFRVQQRLLTLG